MALHGLAAGDNPGGQSVDAVGENLAGSVHLPGAWAGGPSQAAQSHDHDPVQGPKRDYHGPMSELVMPGHQRLIRWVLAIAVAGGPLGYLVGGLFAPAIHIAGPATLAANASAEPVANMVHLAAFFFASFLLPLGAAALAYLSYRRAPWLATIGGLLGVLGWLPFSALAALDDLASTMARLPGDGSYGVLLDRFTSDAVMNTYLLVYVIFHLVAYILFGIALCRGRAIPGWAAWAMIASSPLTVAAFAFHGSARTFVGTGALALLLVGSLPAARAMVTGHRASSVPQ